MCTAINAVMKGVKMFSHYVYFYVNECEQVDDIIDSIF